MSVSEKVLDAIEILATNSVEKAGYDRTIQAQVLSCEDATIGKYRCRYQDSIIYAYSNSADVKYAKGAYVYILIPGNDMGKEKTILGTSQKLGVNYISQAQGDQAYNLIGNNCVTSTNKFYLNTNNKDYRYKIYQYGKTNDVKLDTVGLNAYIKESSSLMVGATFKTKIPNNRQTRGEYGIIYNLRFLDNTSNKQVIRSYIVDEDNIVNNPYKLIYATRQYQIFNIDGSNFIRVESIEIFNRNFPGATGTTTNQKLTSGDIQITKLEFVGMIRMTENEINGVAISFYTPQGYCFKQQDSASSYRTIVAQVKIKGKLISNVQKFPFYWGIEHVGISAKSEYYNKYLGRGWKCLNQKNIISEATASTDPIVEWIPGGDTYLLNFNEATARETKIKVAVVYDNNIITKEIVIQNLATNVPVITIESNSGTTFYYDIGHPTLTCKINGSEISGNKYYWAYESNTGVFSQLPVTTEQNNAYTKAVNELEALKAEIKQGKKFPEQEKSNLERLENAVKDFDYIQRVNKNKIYDVQINRITTFGIFKCSVYNAQDTYLGTASITLKNKLSGENLYSLVINNGAAVYQYNENGVAPNSNSLDIKQEIKGLSFTIYDNLGDPIDSNIVANTKNCKIRWYFPIKDTMLVDKSENGESAGMDATESYKYYDNKLNLIYGIATKYNIKKQVNQIKLTVDYKGMSLTATTNFTFAKQGEPGTNGTQYLMKIVPNTKMSNPPLWPMLTDLIKEQKYVLNYGCGNDKDETVVSLKQQAGQNDKQLFKAQLWRGGELLWEGCSINDIAKDGQSHPMLVKWGVLQNKYKSKEFDYSSFEVTNDKQGNIKYNSNYARLSSPNTMRTWGSAANIIKCSLTWQGKTYYATIPMIVSWTLNSNIRVKLKDYTGFRYVLYTSDGVLPKYDNVYPFEFNVYETMKDENKKEWTQDISLVQGRHAIKYIIGVTSDYQNSKSTIINAKLLKLASQSQRQREKCEKNQALIKPASKYDGMCVNAAVYCTITQPEILSNQVIAGIYIPIHFLLNKYGLSQLNDWDGNSITIDQNGMGLILAPQVGAGQKETDNSFTGVLMGETRFPNKSTSQVGLLGYSHGTRSFFLNSKNGSALFGAPNKAQIIIDPSAQTQKAMIYSGNFWKNYSTDGDDDGLPTGYTYRSKTYKPTGNANEAGMLIDLTTPEIYFGTGNFYVTKDGYVHAAKGGDIAGWKIGEQGLYSNIPKAKGRITLRAGNIDAEGDVIGPGWIYSHTHESLTDTGTGFYLGADGLSFGSKVKITSTGQMYLGTGAVSSTRNHWTIDGNTKDSYIAFGGDTWAAAQVDEEGQEQKKIAKVYLGTDGISIGRKFSINPQGEFTAYSGTIGGWTVTSKKLTANNIELNSNGSLSGGTTYEWSIAKNGTATFKKVVTTGGTIGGWTIGTDKLKAGNIELKSNGQLSGGIRGKNNYRWHIYEDGQAVFNHITANNIIANSQGQIGGWTISENQLSAGSLHLKNSGAIDGPSWSIDTKGNAYFGKISGIVASGDTFEGGGTTITGGDNGGTQLSASRTTVGNENLSTYIKKLVVERLNVTDAFSFNGHSVKWQEVRVCTDHSLKWSTITTKFLKDVTLKDGDLNKTFSQEYKWVHDLEGVFKYRRLYLLVQKGDEE